MNKCTKIFMVCLTLLLVTAAQPALGSDWAQTHKDEVNSGVTGDSAPIVSPNMNWSYDISNGQFVGIDASPIVYNGSVYTVTANASLTKYSLDGKAAGGSWPFKFATAGASEFQNGGIAAGNGYIYLVDSGYIRYPNIDLYSINATTGSVGDSENVTLSFPIRVQFSTPVTYAENKNGKNYILFGSVNMSARDPVNLSDGGKYYCYDVTDPTNLVRMWDRNCSSGRGYYWAGAAIIGDFAVFGDDAGHIVSVNYTNVTADEPQVINNTAGQNETNVSAIFNVTSQEIRSSVTYSNETGKIYFTSKGGYCYALGFNASNGSVNTSDKMIKSIGYSTSAPAYYNGRIYVGNNNGFSSGYLYCLNASNLSQEIWKAPVGPVQSSPVISSFYGQGKEYIYVTTNSATGGIICVDSNGNTVWSETSPGTNRYCLAGAAISGGWVFYGNDEGYLCGRANYTRYDFNGSTDMWAYKYQVEGVPGNKNEPDEEFSSAEYNAIKVDDNVPASHDTINDGYSASHRFVFHIDDNEKPWITSINVTWKGEAYRNEGTDGATLYIWNGTAYEYLADGADGTNEFSLIGGVTSNFGNYIDVSGNVTVLVVQKDTQDLDTSRIETDYVKLVVTP